MLIKRRNKSMFATVEICERNNVMCEESIVARSPHVTYKNHYSITSSQGKIPYYANLLRGVFIGYSPMIRYACAQSAGGVATCGESGDRDRIRLSLIRACYSTSSDN